MIETVVESIRPCLAPQHRVVILKEVDGERQLPIWIGEYEAGAIARELLGETASRPLPHDLMRNLIGSLGGEVKQIMVVDLNQDVFYARILIRVDDRMVEVDSRPSDAIALAVRVKVPIMVDDRVMDSAGVQLGDDDDDSDDDTSEFVEVGGDDNQITPPPDEALAVFRDFINTLDFDDFDPKRGN